MVDVVTVPTEGAFVALTARVVKIEALIDTLTVTIDSLYALLHPV